MYLPQADVTFNRGLLSHRAFYFQNHHDSNCSYNFKVRSRLAFDFPGPLKGELTADQYMDDTFSFNNMGTARPSSASGADMPIYLNNFDNPDGPGNPLGGSLYLNSFDSLEDPGNPSAGQSGAGAGASTATASTDSDKQADSSLKMVCEDSSDHLSKKRREKIYKIGS